MAYCAVLVRFRHAGQVFWPEGNIPKVFCLLLNVSVCDRFEAKEGIVVGRYDAISDRIMLEKIKDQLDRQERTTSYLFVFNLGVGFMGLGAGVGITSLASKQVDFLGLSLVLLITGALLICWAGLERRQYYRRRLAVTGIVLAVAGVLTIAFPLPCITPMIQQPIGALLVLLGAILMTLAGWLPERKLLVRQTRGSQLRSN